MIDFFKTVECIIEQHSEYKKEAYPFVMSALHYSSSKFNPPRHLSGDELCWGIRDYALEQFGVLAKTVFEYWGITTTLDFGKIVYYMIDAKLMSKTDEDKLEDFNKVYSFDKSFSKIEYEI